MQIFFFRIKSILFLKSFLLFALTVCGFVSTAQTLSADETELYNMIMAYRKSKGLPKIPLSKSLTLVAQTHVQDLEDNFERGSECNFHSWSDQGKWKPVCYTSNHAQAKLMWSKPQELTSYKGNGYEIAFAESEEYLADAEHALQGWKLSKAHNAVILNRDRWKKKWNAIGIGINGSYAVVWFGNEADQ